MYTLFTLSLFMGNLSSYGYLLGTCQLENVSVTKYLLKVPGGTDNKNKAWLATLESCQKRSYYRGCLIVLDSVYSLGVTMFSNIFFSIGSKKFSHWHMIILTTYLIYHISKVTAILHLVRKLRSFNSIPFEEDASKLIVFWSTHMSENTERKKIEIAS